MAREQVISIPRTPGVTWRPGRNAAVALWYRRDETQTSPPTAEPEVSYTMAGTLTVRLIPLSIAKLEALRQLWPEASAEIGLPPYAGVQAGDELEIGGERWTVQSTSTETGPVPMRRAICARRL